MIFQAEFHQPTKIFGEIHVDAIFSNDDNKHNSTYFLKRWQQAQQHM